MINTNIDTLLLAGATGGGANDWRGSWIHSTMDTSYGKFLKSLRISFRIFYWKEAQVTNVCPLIAAWGLESSFELFLRKEPVALVE